QPWTNEDGIYKTVVLAAGNNGTENNRQGNPKGYYSVLNESKNAIVVGNYDDGEAVINSSSSHGPTRDGRLKPDIVAPGTDIMSTAFADPTWFGTAPFYEEGSGTSQAAPLVSGIVGLMHQVHRDRTPSCMGHDNLCSEYNSDALRNATMKALLIQTAQDLVLTKADAASRQLTPNVDLEEGQGQPTHSFYGPGPDYSTGWGLVDADQARRHVFFERYREEFDLQHLEERRYDLTLSWDGPQRVTIAWDDAPSDTTTPDSGAAAREAKRLVNDIDMYLIDPNGQMHY